MKFSRILVLIISFAAFGLIFYAIARRASWGEQNFVGDNALPSLSAPVVKPPDVSQEDSVQVLVNDATDLGSPHRAESAERLILLAKADKDSYATISKVLIDKLKASCGSDELLSTPSEFTRVESLAVILAKMKELGALDALVECSDRRRNFGGLSHTNYPTFEPIVEFGELAVPTLISKYRYSDTITKCRLTSIVAMIGGPKASQNLKALQLNEVDDRAKQCVENSLRVSSNKRE